MDPLENEIMYQAEIRHWWYLGMAGITRAILARWYGAGDRLKILDAGCGTGAAMTTYLAEYGRVSGLDRSADALKYCVVRKADRLVQASADEIPFKKACFDLVASFDVLSDAGVKSDHQALAEIYRVLVPGGRLILRLPAYAWLRGNHDRAVLTSRRYTAGGATRLFDQVGFRVDFCSYVNMLLFPPIALKRLLERLHPDGVVVSDLNIQAGRLNSVFKKCLELEALLMHWARLPFGLSVLLVGRKP
jgi:SAM-dependent methyltransferase